MANLSKSMRAMKEKVTPGKAYSIEDAYNLLKEFSRKFEQRFDISVNLGVDPRKSDQVVRCAIDLPHGTGRSVRIAVFAQGDNAEAAKAAGADIVGFEDLAAEIKAGNMDFDVVIAEPGAMRIVGQLGQILGPRGLMPNPKVGTVSPDVAGAVAKSKAGQFVCRTDKAGIIHGSIGKESFTLEQIKGNLEAVMQKLKQAKPSSAKGVYFKKLYLSTTMGPGLMIDLSSIEI